MKFKFKLLFAIALLFSGSTFSQSILVSTGFDGYDVSVASPSGWYTSWNVTTGPSSPSFYISPGNFGASSPGYKMGGVSGDSVIIISPPFANADSLSFFIKMNSGGGGTAPQSTLVIYESTDSTIWTQIFSMDTLPTTGVVLKVGVSSAVNNHVRMVYKKVAGNIAIDDIKLLDYPIGVPTAASSNNSTVCINDTLYFSDASSIIGATITSWTWNFGDASPTSSSPNPSHAYSTAGPFNVTLTITCSNATTDDTTFIVNVKPLPVAAFTATNVAGCAPLCTQFTDASTVGGGGTIASHVWNYGNGGNSTTPNPLYCYPTSGTFNVTLTVTSDAGCVKSNTMNNLVTVDSSPMANFSFSVSGGTATFTNSSTGASTSVWSFGDGSPDTSSTNATHNFPSNGNYNVCLIVTATGGCTDTLCYPVAIVGMSVEPILNSPLLLSVSPNPSKGLITVDVTNLTSDHTAIKVYTIIGKEIENLNVNKIGQGLFMVDLSSQVDGFYFVRVHTPKEVYTWRVAISR